LVSVVLLVLGFIFAVSLITDWLPGLIDEFGTFPLVVLALLALIGVVGGAALLYRRSQGAWAIIGIALGCLVFVGWFIWAIGQSD
jgi:hypothetical protein